MQDRMVIEAQAALDRAIVEAAKVAMRAERVAALGTADEYEDGVIVAWERTFDANGGTTYNYVARKTGLVWYLSGRDQNPLSWESLIERHLQFADAVWLATTLERLA